MIIPNLGGGTTLVQFTFSPNGTCKTVRNACNNELLSSITIGRVLYERNSTYKTYNNVEGNKLLMYNDIYKAYKA